MQPRGVDSMSYSKDRVFERTARQRPVSTGLQRLRTRARMAPGQKRTGRSGRSGRGGKSGRSGRSGHICLEVLFDRQQRRQRLDPELLYLARQMGLQLGQEYQKQYDKVVIKTTVALAHNPQPCRSHFRPVPRYHVGKLRESLLKF